MQKNSINNYFCLDCAVFFSSRKKEQFCPVCRNDLINVVSWKFLKEWEQRCPVTFERLELEDPEYLIYNPEKKMFHSKKIKRKVEIGQLEGSLLESGIEQLKFLSVEQYKKIRNQYGKKAYIINDDGSFEEKFGE